MIYKLGTSTHSCRHAYMYDGIARFQCWKTLLHVVYALAYSMHGYVAIHSSSIIVAVVASVAIQFVTDNNGH